MITDGTSTTIFCGELAGRPDLWQRGVKKIASCPCQGGNLVPVDPDWVPRTSRKRRRMLGLSRQRL